MNEPAGTPRNDARSRPVLIAPYSREWPVSFLKLGSQLRTALGGAALRIDHIGSTAVPGLAAKPIIDIQISVAAFEPFAPIRRPLEDRGYVWRSDNPDRTKRYFRESPGTTPIHIHVRRHGSWSEQFALLFRDFLRARADVAERYATLKRELAEQYRADRHAYTDAKAPFIWSVMAEASDWSQHTGWAPASSNA